VKAPRASMAGHRGCSRVAEEQNCDSLGLNVQAQRTRRTMQTKEDTGLVGVYVMACGFLFKTLPVHSVASAIHIPNFSP
jgi:hypothetical protein